MGSVGAVLGMVPNRCQLVTYASDGVDHAWAEFSPQQVDIHVNRIAVRCRAVTVQRLFNLVAAQYLIFPSNEYLKNAKLTQCQCHVLTVPTRSETKREQFELPVHRGTGVSFVRMESPLNRSNPRRQLVQVNNGLLKKSSAPLFSMQTRSRTLACALTTITGTRACI